MNISRKGREGEGERGRRGERERGRGGARGMETKDKRQKTKDKR